MGFYLKTVQTETDIWKHQAELENTRVVGKSAGFHGSEPS